MKILSITTLLLLFMFDGIHAQKTYNTIRKLPAKEAFQAVAVDSSSFYAIDSRSIGKYSKRSGQNIGSWKVSENSPIKHLDSGVVINGKLYAAHSNYPEIPMASSVEVWNTQNMKHIGSHSFGIFLGSLTWIDRHEGYWWGVFAHYDEFEDDIGKDNRWTTLVKFNNKWKPVESWKFPNVLLNKFDGKSNSGGSWGPDGKLYLTGHDRAELYVVKIPTAGSTLQLNEVIPVENEGQGIAWDRSANNIIYMIKRSNRQVIVGKIN